MSSSTLLRRRPATSAENLNSAPQRLVLEPAAGPDSLQTVVLAPGRYHLGSDSECDIHVPVPGVAPRHCLIVVGPSRSVVKSLAPLTWLNDGVLRESPLRPGDRLIAGPIEWTIRDHAPPSDADAPAGSGSATEIDLLLDDAASRAELADAAAAVRRDWDRHRQAVAPDRSPSAAPTPTPVPVEERRAHLAELAASFVSREQELVARETDVRCQWDELQHTWTAAREFERLAQSDRAAVAAERTQILAERQSLAAVRHELDAARADLESRTQDIARREADLARRADEVAATHTQLTARSAELQRRESDSTELHHHATQLDTRAAQRESDLAQRELQLSQRELQLAQRDQQLAHRETDAGRLDSVRAQQAVDSEHRAQELSHREQHLAERERIAADREHALEQRGHDLAGRERHAAERDQRQAHRDEELHRRDQALEQREAEQHQLVHSAAEREHHYTERNRDLAEREQALARRHDDHAHREQSLTARESHLAQRESELTASDAERSQQAQQFLQQHSQFTQREQALAAQQQDLTRRHDEHAERERNLADRESALHAQAEANSQREQHLAAREVQLAQQESALNAGDAERSSLSEQFLQQQSHSVQREQEIAAREHELARRVDEHTQRERFVVERESALQVQADSHAHRELSLATRDAALADRESAMASAADRHTEQTRLLTQHEINFTQRDQELLVRERQLSDRDSHLDEREQRLADRQQALHHQGDALTLREQQASSLDQAAVDRTQTLDQRERELADRQAELAARELHVAEQTAHVERRLSESGHPAATEVQSVQPVADDWHARRQHLDDDVEQLRADREALKVAQLELEDRWRNIESEHAALDAARDELTQQRVRFTAEHDELKQLRTAHDADEAIWDKRRALLDAREQDLERRAAQLDEAAAEFAARAQAASGGRDGTILFGEQTPGLVSHPDEAAWLAAAKALNDSASKDLLDERTALEAVRQQLNADCEEFTNRRDEWTAQVAADQQRRAGHDVDVAQLQSQWEEFRAARAEFDSQQAAFSEQRHELCRQLREFADAKAAAAAALLPPEPDVGALPATDKSASVFGIAAAGAGAASDVPPADHSATCTIDLGDFMNVEGSFADAADPQAPPEFPADVELADHDSPGGFPAADVVCAEPQSAPSPTAAEPGQQQWWPQAETASVDFFNSTGVYDAGAALAEDRFEKVAEETTAWSPDSLSGLHDPHAHSSPEHTAQPAEEPPPRENESVLALRSRLADMFGLSRNSNSRATIPLPESFSLHEPRHDSQAAVEDAESTDNDAAAELPAFGQPHPRTPVEPTPATPTPSEDVSIEAYMERLLARSRPQLEVPKDILADIAPHDSRTALKPSAEIEPPAQHATPHVTKILAPEEREALRANLDSFRELANISARSAVAKHQSTKLQTVVQIKVIVLAIAGGVTIALWVAGWFSTSSYLPYTAAAALATIVMLADVVRTLLAISQLKSLEAAGEAEVAASGGLPDESQPELRPEPPPAPETL